MACVPVLYAEGWVACSKNWRPIIPSMYVLIVVEETSREKEG